MNCGRVTSNEYPQLTFLLRNKQNYISMQGITVKNSFGEVFFHICIYM